ncbi:MAG: histidine kinase, partial [Bacteroidota bacterium]
RHVSIQLDIEGKVKDQVVAPMLFIPFIENALKHSHIEDTENSWVTIQLRSSEGKIDFVVINSLPQESIRKDEVGGVGLENVRRRLNLLYFERYGLDIQEYPDQFKIHLTLQS